MGSADSGPRGEGRHCAGARNGSCAGRGGIARCPSEIESRGGIVVLVSRAENSRREDPGRHRSHKEGIARTGERDHRGRLAGDGPSWWAMDLYMYGARRPIRWPAHGSPLPSPEHLARAVSIGIFQRNRGVSRFRTFSNFPGSSGARDQSDHANVPARSVPQHGSGAMADTETTDSSAMIISAAARTGPGTATARCQWRCGTSSPAARG